MKLKTGERPTYSYIEDIQITYISASLVIRRMQIKPQRDTHTHTHTHTHKLPDRQTLKCLSIPNDMTLFELWFSQGICPVLGLLGSMVVLFLVF